jgi:hypothetical protein
LAFPAFIDRAIIVHGRNTVNARHPALPWARPQISRVAQARAQFMRPARVPTALASRLAPAAQLVRGLLRDQA